MKRIFAALAILAATISAGCHAQVPPASAWQVNLVWTAPSASGSWTGCTAAAPCVYAVYRAAQASGSCPAFTSAAWTEITTAASRPSGTAYSDLSASGTVCYAIETVQGTANSAQSNTASATIPASPLAPQLGTPSLVADAKPLPQASDPQLALAAIGSLRVTTKRM